jgi:hypothetical protein
LQRLQGPADDYYASEPTSEAELSEAEDAQTVADTTEHHAAEASMASSGSRIARGRGRGGATGRGGRMTLAKKRERLVAFSLSIIDTLEIKYREEQVRCRFCECTALTAAQPFRSEVEQIIMILREHPDGLYSKLCLRAMSNL